MVCGWDEGVVVMGTRKVQSILVARSVAPSTEEMRSVEEALPLEAKSSSTFLASSDDACEGATV